MINIYVICNEYVYIVIDRRYGVQNHLILTFLLEK